MVSVETGTSPVIEHFASTMARMTANLDAGRSARQVPLPLLWRQRHLRVRPSEEAGRRGPDGLRVHQTHQGGYKFQSAFAGGLSTYLVENDGFKNK